MQQLTTWPSKGSESCYKGQANGSTWILVVPAALSLSLREDGARSQVLKGTHVDCRDSEVLVPLTHRILESAEYHDHGLKLGAGALSKNGTNHLDRFLEASHVSYGSERRRQASAAG